jgi:replicative DNA helicase
MQFEHTILFNLCFNNDFTQQVISHLKKDYFDSFYTKEIFEHIQNYINEYKSLPTKSVIQHELSKSSKYNEKQYEEIKKTLEEIFEYNEKHNVEWLVDETEKYCQNVSFENALVAAFDIYKNDKKNKAKAIELMKESLSIEFDAQKDLIFFDEENIDKRHEEYNKPYNEFLTGFETFDIVCPLRSGAIYVLMAPSGVGKTLGMISLTSGLLKHGYKVGYITLEMSKYEISKRVEANLLGFPINNIKTLEKETFKNSLLDFKKQSYGQLMIAEFPTASACCLDFEKIINDWKLKHGFVPDVLMLDYLNIALSNRIKDGNSYSIVKAITEEFRGMCQRYDFAGVTGTQTGRNGFNSSKLNASDVSDSIGTVYTADVLISITSTKQMQDEGFQVWSPTSKNRCTGILNYYWPMIVNTELSRLEDGSHIAYNNEIFLNNNPETLERIEKMRVRKDNHVIKKYKKNEKENKNAEILFFNKNSEDEEFFDMIEKG